MKMKKIISIFTLFVIFSFCSSGPEASIDIFEAAKTGNIEEINLHIEGDSASPQNMTNGLRFENTLNAVFILAAPPIGSGLSLDSTL